MAAHIAPATAGRMYGRLPRRKIKNYLERMLARHPGMRGFVAGRRVHAVVLGGGRLSDTCLKGQSCCCSQIFFISAGVGGKLRF